jgi:hypothetical protein
MQCHLGWCFSFRRDLTLELFTRGHRERGREPERAAGRRGNRARCFAVLAVEPAADCASFETES